MADSTVDDTELDADTPKKKGKLPLIIGFVLALLGAGGGFFAVSSGLLMGGDSGDSEHLDQAESSEDAPLPDVGFVEVPPLLVSLPRDSVLAHLRFAASLEVPTEHISEVERIMPRIQDALNGYLRALKAADFEAPGALQRLRGQMLRRVKLVAGEGRVTDLLVLEFVLN